MKRLLTLTVLILCLFLFNSCSKSTSHQTPTSWTYVFYCDADCGSMYEPLEDFALQARSGENFNVIILQDVFGDDTVLYQIDTDHNIIELENWGERNMGDPETLYDLLNYADTNFKADKYILAIYDHGKQWEGSCVDDTDNDRLTLDETQQALTAFGGVNMVLFTAPCFMGCMEAAYELRNLCEYFVASENYSGYYLWEDVIDDICNTIISDSESKSRDLAEMMVSLAEESCLNYGVDFYTLSAIDTSKLDALATAINDVCTAYITEQTDFLTTWLVYKLDVAAYGFAGYNVYNDIYSWAQMFKEHETNAEIIAQLETMQQALLDCVVAYFTDADHPEAHGLSVFFKAYHPFNSNNYPLPDYGLDLCIDTNWDELQSHFFGFKSAGEDVEKLMKNLNGYK